MFKPGDVVIIHENYENLNVSLPFITKVLNTEDGFESNKGEWVTVEAPKRSGWECSESSTGKAWTFPSSMVEFYSLYPRFMIEAKSE